MDDGTLAFIILALAGALYLWVKKPNDPHDEGPDKR